MQNLQNTTIQILDIIARIYSAAEDSKLAPKFIKKIETDLAVLESYFGVSQMQALFLVLVFVQNHKSGRLDFADIVRYTSCEDLFWLKKISELEELKQKGLLKIFKTESRRGQQFVQDFEINQRVSSAILLNEPMPEKLFDEKENILDVLEAINNVVENAIREDIINLEMISEVSNICQQHIHFKMIESVTKLGLSIEDQILFYYITWKTLIGKSTIDLDDLSNAMHNTQSKSIKYMHCIIEEINTLVQNNFIETLPSRFGNDVMVKLAPAGEKFLQANKVPIVKIKVAHKDAIYPKDIVQKELFYSGEEHAQLQLIENTLAQHELVKIQERLHQKKLPKGITILLHGAAGTGKTESVLQIAKATDRAIMKVDLSKTKSMWFGESEKIVKKIFTTYKSFAEDCVQLPILLFNETDGLLGKRKEVNSSNVAQTENTIQNILLDELENFEGILMATTNLVGNLDSAFDRRFLFKVNFIRPSMEAKVAIWKSKLPDLLQADYNLLAQQFDLSGGQIDNIIRKIEIDEIINGKNLSLETVMQFCEEESFGEKKSVIGFGRG
jgi:AAA+ superfamily predicted ATPase